MKFIILVAIAACTPSVLPATDSATKVTHVDDNATPVYSAQVLVVQSMAAEYPALDLDLRFIPCGELNGFYSPSEKTIYLCTEFAAYPAVALFVAAHETGHAIAMQFLHVGDEESADELGALAMIHQGLLDELLETAIFFREQGEGGTGGGHPANSFRAWNLACLEAGSEGTPICDVLYRGTKARWDRRLADYR